MCQLHAGGCTCGAGGELQEGRVVGSVLTFWNNGLGQLPVIAGNVGKCVNSENARTFGAGSVSEVRADRAGSSFRCEDDGGLGCVQYGCQVIRVARLLRVIHRDGNDTSVESAEEGEHVLRAVSGHDGDVLAGLGDLLQTLGDGFNELIYFVAGVLGDLFATGRVVVVPELGAVGPTHHALGLENHLRQAAEREVGRQVDIAFRISELPHGHRKIHVELLVVDCGYKNLIVNLR